MAALETLGFDPYIATGRQRHHAPQAEVHETPATVQERYHLKNPWLKSPCCKQVARPRREKTDILACSTHVMSLPWSTRHYAQSAFDLHSIADEQARELVRQLLNLLEA